MVDRRKNLDWRGEIMNISDAARANNLSPEVIRASAKQSADELLAMFELPYKVDRDLNKELLKAVSNAIQNIDLDSDQTAGTKKYVEKLRTAQAALLQNRLSWAEWVSLSKAAPTKSSLPFAEPVQIIAGDFEKHPGLHSDIRNFSVEAFELAADSIEAFQTMKKQKGMLDFVDQEHRLFKLLDHPHVKAALADELQVLFVDEFQDTSPIQLALFMKLAALANQVIWVGDIKQAIYGFRGSDPKLMQAVLHGVTEGGGTTDVLKVSWRSGRRWLVTLTRYSCRHSPTHWQRSRWRSNLSELSSMKRLLCLAGIYRVVRSKSVPMIWHTVFKGLWIAATR